ncbi:MAG TPA: hypothetical protein VK400_03150 [Pyrinomonadaceae bacterium]|nr:hypothetical protein [Pyrinomonadaceae bacterium]
MRLTRAKVCNPANETPRPVRYNNRMIEKTEYHGADCLKLSNGEAELIVSTAYGPRILFYGFTGGENILGWHGDAKVETALGEWRPYGGHRLWIAPENMPLSYAPDNSAVEYFIENDYSARFVQPPENQTKTQKEIVVTLGEKGSETTVEHRVTNRGDAETELSAWALTIMRGGGCAVIPNEPFKPYSGENLLPVRAAAFWSYTDLTDSRWRFEKDFIRLHVDEAKPEPQKIGVLNRQGWTAYERQNLLFVKRFDFAETAVYPDMNSNTEVYTAGSFVEVESLSPLQKLPPGESLDYVERWQLFENTSIKEFIEK